jgi:hypothetical protein
MVTKAALIPRAQVEGVRPSTLILRLRTSSGEAVVPTLALHGKLGLQLDDAQLGLLDR